MMIKTHVVVFFINRLIFTIGKQRVVLVARQQTVNWSASVGSGLGSGSGDCNAP